MWSPLQIDTLLASVYLLLWVATMIWYHYRRREVDSGSVIIFFYVLYGVISVYSVNDDLIAMSPFSYAPLTLLPYVYLYVMMMIALLPVIYVHHHPTTTISDPHTRLLNVVAVIIIVSCLLRIPSLLSNARTGLMELIINPDAGKEAYSESIAAAEEANTGISNIPAIIFNATSDIGIFLFFYFLTLRQKSKLILAGLGAAMVVAMITPLLSGLRGGVVISLQTAIMAYFLFRRYLSPALNRAINIGGATLIALIAIPVLAITLSRAGNRGITSFGTWYVGQGSLYFNNYAFDTGGTRNGDRTFNLAKRLVDPTTPRNYVERREKYWKMNIDDYIFTTFVGDFVIDFGPWLAVVLFVVFFCWARHMMRTRGDTIELSQLLLLYIVASVSIQGGMSLYSYADAGGLRLLTALLLYAYLAYHKHLLERFPLAATEQ